MANQGSWPSIGYLTFVYTFDQLLQTGVTITLRVTKSSLCDATLISTRKVLTAGNNYFTGGHININLGIILLLCL